ncbi:MAG: hypothetical protein QNJ47_15320 [Nostocaceae cyanobacterium]|nr:hypothetical protein [Nostocaceae cyanobacterium]
MVKQVTTDCQERLEQFLSAVEAAQKLQDDILKYGLNAAYLYCEDLEGDWLERWDEDKEEDISLKIVSFLESDDTLALTVRNLLKDKSLSEIAVELEKYLSLDGEEERIFAVKTFLVDNVLSRESNYSFGDGIDLLELAEKLVKKLVYVVESGK